MPALSKKQQKFMGIVRSIQKGEQPASKFSKDAQDVAKDMKKKDVKKFASTKHKGLPMKKEVLNKLKEMIKQELSEYTYGVGDVVKDVNPTCPHYGAQGKVKSVNPRSVVFVVMNKGKNFKPGMELEKSHDQMKKMNENKVYKVGDTVSLLSFDRRNRGKAKVKSVAKSRPNKFGIKNHYVTDKGIFTDMEVEGTEAFKLRFKGNTEKQVMKAMQSPGSAITRESVNEFSMKLQKSTQDMVDALLKVKSPMPKEIESALIMMAKGYGLDYVKREVQKDAKGFYKNLKQMAAAFPEFKNKPKDYKFESIIQERNDEVQTGKDYTKLWLQSIGLVINHANSLKGQLSKHPIKRDINKLKAVETLFKRFIKPSIETAGATNRHYAPNQTELKKYLSNSKFKIAVRILRQTIESSNGYDENSWYYLGDKEKQLIKKMSRVLLDIENKMEKANLESVNEASVSQVRSTISRVKKQLMKKWDKKGGYENFGQKELRNLKSKFKENPYGSPEERQISQMLSAFNNWAMNYSGDMRESVNEDGHTDVASSKRKVMIMVDDSNKLLNKLNGMNKEDSLPSWWSDKITLSQSYLSKATDFLLNPVESVNEKYKKLHPKEKIIVNFRNKKKGFKPDKKVFNDYEKAVKWGRKNVAKFHSDMISFEIPESVNENLRPSDKKILMVIATELVKTQMKGKNKNKIRKELPDILSTMGTNDLSKKSPTNRFNKNKMISLGKGFSKLSDSDKKVFINTLMYNAGLAESVNEGKGVDKIMKMADDYSYGKIAGKTVDVMTAKLFQAVYKKASQKARDRVDKMNEKQLYIFMMNLWKKFGKGLSGQMMN